MRKPKVEKILELLAGPEAAAKVAEYLGEAGMRSLNWRLDEIAGDSDPNDGGDPGPRGG